LAKNIIVIVIVINPFLPLSGEKKTLGTEYQQDGGGFYKGGGCDLK
jgi:hypothetical protein